MLNHGTEQMWTKLVALGPRLMVEAGAWEKISFNSNLAGWNLHSQEATAACDTQKLQSVYDFRFRVGVRFRFRLRQFESISLGLQSFPDTGTWGTRSSGKHEPYNQKFPGKFVCYGPTSMRCLRPRSSSKTIPETCVYKNYGAYLSSHRVWGQPG